MTAILQTTFNKNVSIKISLEFFPNGPISNQQALVQIMAWCRTGDRPLSEPMMAQMYTYVSGHGIAAVLLPGFAINW